MSVAAAGSDTQALPDTESKYDNSNGDDDSAHLGCGNCVAPFSLCGTYMDFTDDDRWTGDESDTCKDCITVMRVHGCFRCGAQMRGNGVFGS